MYNRNRSGAKKPVPTQTTDSSEQHANSGMQLWSCEARIRQSLIPPRANSSRQRIHFNARLKQEAKMSRSTRLFVLFAIVAAYTAIGGGLLQPQRPSPRPHRPRHWLTCAPRAPVTCKGCAPMYRRAEEESSRASSSTRMRSRPAVSRPSRARWDNPGQELVLAPPPQPRPWSATPPAQGRRRRLSITTPAQRPPRRIPCLHQ